MITNAERIRIVKRVQRLLGAKYKATAKSSERWDAMTTLVASALAPNPFRPETQRCIRAMTKEFVDWNEARVTRQAELAALITPHGYPAARAGRLKDILAGLFDHFNAVSLDFLANLEPNPIRTRLSKIEEIKPEDIDNVLLLARGVSVMPLNPHVLRIFQRIGIVKQDASPASIQALFKSALGRDATGPFYERINLLGERVCTATQPQCNLCVLKNECLFGLVQRGLLTEEQALFPLPADVAKRTPKKTAWKGTPKKS